MNSNMVVFVAVLVLVLSLVLILVLTIKYINKRDKGSLQIHIKFGFFEFDMNTSGENVTKKRK